MSKRFIVVFLLSLCLVVSGICLIAAAPPVGSSPPVFTIDPTTGAIVPFQGATPVVAPPAIDPFAQFLPLLGGPVGQYLALALAIYSLFLHKKKSTVASSSTP